MTSFRSCGLPVLAALSVLTCGGCTYAGFSVGERVDSGTNQKLRFDRTSSPGSCDSLMNTIPANTEIEVHLGNGSTSTGVFRKARSIDDSLCFQSGKSYWNIASEEVGSYR